MLGLGWLYSWRMVPAANQMGSAAYSNLLGFFWAWSVPWGAFIVTIGAALVARVERRLIWLLFLLLILFTVWRVAGTTSRIIPALFGAGAGLITLFFIGSSWQWARIRPTLSAAGKTGSDLRMIGFIFFVVAAWDLCGIFGIGNFVLRPDLAEKFSMPLSSTIDAASGVMVLLILGWGFTYFGQLISHQARAAQLHVVKVPQIAATD
jgi:hypothetical protein